jgi:hypothetical protein
MKADSYHISEPIKSICKSHGLWISEGNGYAPLIYFQKPKWIEDEELWQRIVTSIRITLPAGTEIK